GQAIEGLTILTSNQTAGRGQRGNSWEAKPDENLTLSIVLTPNFLYAKEQFQLNLAVSLGIIDFFSGFLGSELKIKWPNDIFHKNSKIGGILIENVLKKNLIEYSIIGIGLNINQEKFDISNASSLKQINNKEYDLTTCVELLLEKLEKRYLQLRSGGPEKMKQEYLNILFKYQEDHTFYDLRNSGKVKFTGQILGINPFGKLAIVTQKGEVMYFDFKEVSFEV
nr:biotin--[acetyl-CoA-carboxylase] ligase [Flammeovirgaceae bacterium]